MPLPFSGPILSALLACLSPKGTAQDPPSSPSFPQVAEAGSTGARVLNIFSEDGKLVRELQPGALVVVRRERIGGVAPHPEGACRNQAPVDYRSGAGRAGTSAHGRLRRVSAAHEGITGSTISPPKTVCSATSMRV